MKVVNQVKKLLCVGGISTPKPAGVRRELAQGAKHGAFGSPLYKLNKMVAIRHKIIRFQMQTRFFSA